MSGMNRSRAFLPVSRKDMEERGWTQCDFILVTGDAYVDHPSFGAAIISRLLERQGFKVGVIAQPDWKSTKEITALGEPRLAFMVTGGNIDSMVNHYSVAKKRRDKDAYTPGGEAGKRPDRAAIVYSNLIRKAFKDAVIILGGIEASLRRLAHYDYWSGKVRRSLLLDAQGDLLIYGMAEKALEAVAEALEAGIEAKDITFVRGTVYKSAGLEHLHEPLLLPSYETIAGDKRAYAESFRIQMEQTDAFTAKPLAEHYDEGGWVVQMPPMEPLSEAEMDSVYDLPFARDYHPMYEEKGGVPAIEEVKFSIIANRGCFGGCHFCALTFHQGRIMQARSKASIVREGRAITEDPGFKGYIHDVGGPTANFRKPSCTKQLTKGVCKHKQCLTPEKCSMLEVDHTEYLSILRELRQLPKVKKVFIRSGVRFDYLLYDKDQTFLRELCEHHVSGQLKVAPEHVSNKVLDYMGKTRHGVYETFTERFKKMNEQLGKKQYLVPYLMSSHPGSTLEDAIELAEYLREIRYQPQQVQDFYPTPATLSTAMYYTGLNPLDMQPVEVPRTPHEKAVQRALMQYRAPRNYKLVKEALIRAGREDLIGFGKECLVRPLAHEAKGPGSKRETPSKPQKKKKAIRNVHKKKK